ncbi:MAG: cytochrome c [Deltaproteobacteria bacterium]|nr:cytochrome c [Deltaproteobacteria bacterium]
MIRKIPAAAPLGAALLLGAALSACQKGGGEHDHGAAQGPPADAAHGKVVFTTTCSTCHGQDGMGVKGLGRDLVTSEFVTESSDEELLKMVNTGRPADDPLNTTKIAMPPKGGNAALSEQDVRDAIAYLRTIHKPS